MNIIKFIKKGNNNYQIVFDNGDKITLNEELILKYKLLYKKEIDPFLLEEILIENEKYNIYDKCIKYIEVRVRSINEIKEYMLRKKIDDDVINITINKLIENKLLDDDLFTRAFVNDKLKFSTMGPYKIMYELRRHKIDEDIINKYIYNIDNELLNKKINKQISKLILRKNKNNLKNKIYNNLVSLGYPKELIINNLNKYDF